MLIQVVPSRLPLWTKIKPATFKVRIGASVLQPGFTVDDDRQKRLLPRILARLQSCVPRRNVVATAMANAMLCRTDLLGRRLDLPSQGWVCLLQANGAGSEWT